MVKVHHRRPTPSSRSFSQARWFELQAGVLGVEEELLEPLDFFSHGLVILESDSQTLSTKLEKERDRLQKSKEANMAFLSVVLSFFGSPSRVSCDDGQKKEAAEPKCKPKSKPPIPISLFPVNSRLSVL
ncbi:hypothetical protein MRB53_026182 [Persea americana]|uniref:Uncharacterized protein n=1 Tax=Persea americana TaxID=3435 RepID=A0ACC2LHC0_PERAE|nr:hypothetical protein MRB53_026182 [Persea americana]